MSQEIVINISNSKVCYEVKRYKDNQTFKFDDLMSTIEKYNDLAKNA